ncbi:hypothetical protein [Paenibacillus sp. GCM10012303]|jgi:hypothetical protein|uniref:hypothetical protein n=1 Tax=Paenibacillus sp. GCM10012303 TaxID=3317340 RepID=UPI003614A805
MKTARLGLAAVLIVMLTTTACGANHQGSASGEGGKAEAEKPKEPYTMKILANGVKTEEFDERFRELLKQKFPHVTVEYSPGAKERRSMIGSPRAASRTSSGPMCRRL